MDTERVIGNKSAEPFLHETVRDHVAARRDHDSLSSTSASHSSSPRPEELNRVMSSSPIFPGTTETPVAYASRLAPSSATRTRTRHRAPDQNTVMHNNSAFPVSPPVYSSQLRQVASGHLSPVPMSRQKSPASLYMPLRLDSQMLASPWPTTHSWTNLAASPSLTRGAAAAGGPSYWVATSSPLPYPCVSPTTYSSGLRNMSPSTTSLRQPLPPHGNDDSSPAQLSISTFGRENSVASAASFTSPAAAGIIHPAILDAPLQLSLVPPPLREDCPYFSFGASIMQSTPFTPTQQSPHTRTHSIYHDTVLELAHPRQELDNPLSSLQVESARGAGPDGVAASAMGTATASSGISFPSNVYAPAGPRSFPPHTVSDASLASATGYVVPAKIVDGALMRWNHLGQLSPSTPAVEEPLTARPMSQFVGEEGTTSTAGKPLPSEPLTEEESEETEEDEEDDDDDNLGDGPPSESADSITSPTMSNPAADVAAALTADGASAQVSEAKPAMRRTLNRTPFMHNGSLDPGSAADLLPKAAGSLNDFSSRSYEDTLDRPPIVSPVLRGRLNTALEIATPHSVFTRRQSNLPLTPVVPPGSVGMATMAVPDYHLFIPSPVDQSAHGFGGGRENVLRRSPSEPSASLLSLVPTFGIWHASPTLVSVWPSSVTSTTAPCIRHAMEDLLEVMRLLQSDINNVYGRVSANEHTVRHWVGCTLSALLRLTADLSHSVSLSTSEVADAAAVCKADAEELALYNELGEEIRTGAVGCAAVVRAAIPAIHRDRDTLEPVLLTSILARDAITDLLHSLESAYVQTATPTAFLGSQGTRKPDEMLPSRHGAPSVPVPAPLDSARIEALMNSERLMEELGGEWRQFANEYNRTVLRYILLRGMLAACQDPFSQEGHGSQPEAAAQRGTAGVNTLRSIESAWVDQQLKRWNALQQRQYSLSEHKDGASSADHGAHEDMEAWQLLGSALCHDPPSHQRVTEVFAAFREDDCWSWWYTLLDQLMECTFDIQSNEGLLRRSEEDFSTAACPATVAALRTLRAGYITRDQVVEALEKAAATLRVMEEEGKAHRVAVLRLILRRIFVLAVVASVHRALGKDAIVSDAQLASYVQMQRKSMEEVESHLTGEHADAEVNAKTLQTFLTLFCPVSRNASQRRVTVPPSGVPASGSFLESAVTPPVVPLSTAQEDGADFYTVHVGPLAALIVGAPPRSSTATSRSDIANEHVHSDIDESQRRTQDVVALARAVNIRVLAVVEDLCTLLQSNVEPAAARKDLGVSPTTLPAYSTRALNRLQASLIEAHHAVLVCASVLRRAN